MSLKTKKPLKISESKGASAVEFALVLPLLAVLIFGIIEFGTLCYDKAVITNASREGARAGILFNRYDHDGDPGTSPLVRVPADEIKNVASSYCSNYLVTFAPTNTPPDIQVNPADPLSANSLDPLTVTVTYHYDFLVIPDLLIAFFSSSNDFGSGVDLVATTVMKME
jgi:Flp pilus assembly protein TadG